MDNRTKQAKIKYEGNLFETNNGGLVRVLNWNSSSDIDVVFINTGYISKVKLGNLCQGTVKDHSIPSTYGVGIVGETVRSMSTERKYLSMYGRLDCFELWYLQSPIIIHTDASSSV